jgi:hypothetical protein
MTFASSVFADAAGDEVTSKLLDCSDGPMSQKKTISEAERQRRLRQAAQTADATSDPKAFGGANRKLTAAHPASVIAKHIKKTGRGD